jgi:hypothetical protein
MRLKSVLATPEHMGDFTMSDRLSNCRQYGGRFTTEDTEGHGNEGGYFGVHPVFPLWPSPRTVGVPEG